MKSYILKASFGKIATSLAKFCAEGEIGESLLREGINQASFNLFLAKLAESRLCRAVNPMPVAKLADLFSLVSGANSSAAQKALATCSIRWELVDEDGASILDKDGNPTWEKNEQSVEAYWAKAGGGKAISNLSLLDE